ncbi:hypothetical protein [Paraburkholderia dinghuensis]|uniref:Uncharacterized protein n=1 Tax=Paraburkholderia dinghuensis TaxID=2305225 RepID=A0A3N6MWD3_9BURK|nr:hypothetical protein [Paraburkholderia dinghuensis]RQG99266.1 hypothetical protein D1Y85_26615 [Paraburkholderia dinghuensis]
MKLTDFQIGLEFMEGPFWWRCTDIGTRSIAAIKLAEDDTVWYAGPPYMIEEVVLDEARIADCHLTEEEHVEAALVEADTSSHPGYPHEALRRMTKARLKSRAYPRTGMFRFDRVWSDGKILHPYAAHKVGEEWIVSFYLPFTQGWGEMSETQFIALPIATAFDIKRRAAQLANPRRT